MDQQDQATVACGESLGQPDPHLPKLLDACSRVITAEISYEAGRL